MMTAQNENKAGEQFVYVTYILSTPEKVWKALTERQFTEQFWYGLSVECDWQQGSPWRLLAPDGTLAHTGRVLEVNAPYKLVLAWQHEFISKLKAEGHTRVTFEIKQLEEMVKLTVVQSSDRTDGNTISVMARGWPLLLASLKTLMETGASLKSSSHWPAVRRSA
ncbi:MULTISPECIES: SRPBCC family protein [unclassified Phyllobacterium]|uniref:SRPBCC family protein n=1 Tax=unclassified Phyllobacterium TaxID=2638441 RepID=UPI003012EE0F